MENIIMIQEETVIEQNGKKVILEKGDKLRVLEKMDYIAFDKFLLNSFIPMMRDMSTPEAINLGQSYATGMKSTFNQYYSSNDSGIDMSDIVENFLTVFAKHFYQTMIK